MTLILSTSLNHVYLSKMLSQQPDFTLNTSISVYTEPCPLSLKSNKTQLILWPTLCLQGAEHCSSLNFGLGSSGPVLGISGSELEEGVEYTFRLTISKEGMAPESTTQTVSPHILPHT